MQENFEKKTNLIGMGVNPCSIFKKDFGYFNMSSWGSLHEWCMAIFVVIFNVGVGL